MKGSKELARIANPLRGAGRLRDSAEPDMDPTFEDEAKPRCPECSQSLTFVRTRSHQKKWYCYSCERYVDPHAQATFNKFVHAKTDSLTGLQVIDSHGMIVGRVRKVVSSESGDVSSLVLSVDRDQLRTLLDDRGFPREFEIGHERIATLGDVVILGEVFSPSALAPQRPRDDFSKERVCRKCGSGLVSDAKYCIKCGASVLHNGSCRSCGTPNPSDASFCKNCGNRLS